MNNTAVLTDHRCPKCNQIVKGRTDVTFSKPQHPAVQCQHCGTRVLLVCYKDRLGNELAARTYSYTTAGKGRRAA